MSWFFLLNSCQQEPKEHPDETLAKQYCSNCHLYTGPELLDKTSWLKVLPTMKGLIEKSGVPLPKKDWNRVYSYIYNSAPLFLSTVDFDTSAIFSSKFEIRQQEMSSDTDPNIILAQCASDSKYFIGNDLGQLILASADQTNIIATDLGLPVDLEVIDTEVYDILSMGTIGPDHRSQGVLYRVEEGVKSVLIDSLHRPIDFTKGDVDGDGVDEYIISSFGTITDDQETGDLSLFNYEDDRWVRYVVSRQTGASKSQIIDLNKDGQLDIVALFAQGNEKVSVFYNEGDFNFREEVLINNHPIYGTLDFRLANIDDDDDPELIVVNGDNADYSVVFKPYHGLRIYDSDGTQEYDLAKFYQINGASDLFLDDYDNDGDLDIGVFALYPNITTRPWETLQIFDNNQNLDFKRSASNAVSGNHWVRCAICKDKNSGKSSVLLGANRNINKVLPFRQPTRGLQMYTLSSSEK